MRLKGRQVINVRGGAESSFTLIAEPRERERVFSFVQFCACNTNDQDENREAVSRVLTADPPARRVRVMSCGPRPGGVRLKPARAADEPVVGYRRAATAVFSSLQRSLLEARGGRRQRCLAACRGGCCRLRAGGDSEEPVGGYGRAATAVFISRHGRRLKRSAVPARHEKWYLSTLKLNVKATFLPTFRTFTTPKRERKDCLNVDFPEVRKGHLFSHFHGAFPPLRLSRSLVQAIITASAIAQSRALPEPTVPSGGAGSPGGMSAPGDDSSPPGSILMGVFFAFRDLAAAAPRAEFGRRRVACVFEWPSSRRWSETSKIETFFRDNLGEGLPGNPGSHKTSRCSTSPYLLGDNLGTPVSRRLIRCAQGGIEGDNPHSRGRWDYLLSDQL
ncbi:hypothetical protein Bbelb_376040 [Branchiostoma belcheri]|nr:hypothetical protein Bbelb_376040 [Branchiostoma belcheri]